MDEATNKLLKELIEEARDEVAGSVRDVESNLERSVGGIEKKLLSIASALKRIEDKVDGLSQRWDPPPPFPQ
ncbi:MAG: hypothetical protein JRF49_11515 [Deltaproteobacteria bacterium]|nr:hypothetical protein [Deltaproteobacteria bacterium]